jgi:CSLREA domain-containing protein
VLACALVVSASASAAEFEVDSTADKSDAVLGVGCLAPIEECTLRAAIEESNGSEEFDAIEFDIGLFDGQGTGTIVLGGSLPAIVGPARIHGRECLTAAAVSGPCVGIDGPSGGPALTIENAEEVEIEGLAVTGAETGISAEGSPRLKVQSSWFGIELDGDGGGNGTGIFIGPGSNGSRIGGEGPEAGNVFADSTSDGLDIHGARNVRVLGNYFGVEKDGETPAANGGKDIEVTSTSGGEFEATGTAIGTRVRAEGVASPGCDFGCNVISDAGSSGIDLEGDGGSEAPAAATTIAGNYIGLSANGTTAVPNASSGIQVGEAAQTVIGGPKAGEANRVNGGSVAVLAGPAAADLVVRGNLIGVDAAGTGSLAPPDEGIAVNSEGLSSPAVEAVIAGNEIRMEGGVAVAQRGFGARVAGNEISGAKTGIKTFEFTAEHGNLIEGNSLEGLEGSGILVENDLNEVLGNEIFGAVGAGIWVLGSLPFGVTENLVGGDTATEENVIVGSGGDAIEISDVEETENGVARNRGFANSGPFIDLVALSPGTEPNGPNNGIKPPGFSTATQAGASGSGAKAGARVRVFRKQTAAAGELDSFLGEATVGSGGGWKVSYDGAIPAGTIVAATQTSEAGGTSELATATTTGEAGGGGGGGGGANSGGASNGTGSPPVDQTAPQTTIVKASKRKPQSSTARFRFVSNESGSTFQCKLDGKPFRVCKSPKKYEDLKPGRHVFQVRATDPAGNVDSSPAKREFTVRR